MMKATHNSSNDVRGRLQPVSGCVGLSGWFFNFQ